MVLFRAFFLSIGSSSKHIFFRDIIDSRIPGIVLSSSFVITSVSCGAAHTLALTKSGEGFFAWGSNEFGQLGLDFREISSLMSPELVRGM